MKIFFKYASYFIALTVLIFHILSYFFAKYEGETVFFIVWSLISVVNTILGFMYGKNVERLHRCAYRDELTKLGNRREFYSTLTEELQRMKKRGGCLSFALVDIDNLKIINDTYGHIAGDNVIKQVSNILKGNIRDNDAAVRWGGDEFAIILPNLDTDNAFKFADRIRSSVEKAEYQFNPSDARTTVSIGIVSVKDDTDPEKIVDLADEALYKSKKTKNMVTFFNHCCMEAKKTPY